MGTITDNKGNVIREFVDTLEDWKQAAEVEAGLRRELQQKHQRLCTSVREALRVSGLNVLANKVAQVHELMDDDR